MNAFEGLSPILDLKPCVEIRESLHFDGMFEHMYKTHTKIDSGGHFIASEGQEDPERWPKVPSMTVTAIRIKKNKHEMWDGNAK